MADHDSGIDAARRQRLEMATRAWGRVRGRPGRSSLSRGAPLSRDADDDVLAVHRALDQLERIDGRLAAVVELRFFGNLNLAEVAEVLGCPRNTVETEWTVARAWLRRELHVEVASGESVAGPSDPDGGGNH